MWDENSDLTLAIQLQNEWNDQAVLLNNDGNHEKQKDPQSLVDPSWELLDPNPDARVLFLQFNDRFFWGKLAGVEVRWSPRMTLCAGLCVYEGRGGLCSVRLSLPLLKLRPRKDLVETLLHEMIHAYLFVTDNNKDHDGHGPEFHKHMYRINADAGTNISVYHTFHDEVDNYRQHWWKCDGPCQKRPPYFGYVKRAMNRAPSARDPWWADHQRNCGGTYTKVKEPEGYGQKKSKKKDGETKKMKPETTGKTPDIRSIFSGKGIKASSNSSHVPALPNLNSTKSSNIAGFVKSENDDGLLVYKDNAAANKQQNPSHSFPGDGKTLATSSNWKDGRTGNLNIVRKLPGIGMVANTRPVEKPIDLTGANAKDDSDDDILIYSPVRKMGAKPGQNKQSPSKSDIRTWMNTEHKKMAKSTVILSDSDTEFDELLSKAKHQKKSSSSSSFDSFTSTPLHKKRTSPEVRNHRDKSSPGFQSVCTQRTNESQRTVENKVYKIQDENCGSGKKEGYTAQRNKRAHDLGSSSSDSDIDAKEKLSLLSVIRKKKKKVLGNSTEVKDRIMSGDKSQSSSTSVCQETPSSVQYTSSFTGSLVKDKTASRHKTQGSLTSFSQSKPSGVQRTSSFTGSDSKSFFASVQVKTKSPTSSRGSTHSVDRCSEPKTPVVEESQSSGSYPHILSETPSICPSNEAPVTCPVCNTSVSSRLINEHLDSCLS